MRWPVHQDIKERAAEYLIASLRILTGLIFASAGLLFLFCEFWNTDCSRVFKIQPRRLNLIFLSGLRIYQLLFFNLF